MSTAVLALQGAFIEHEQKLAELGETFFELRCRADLDKPFDRLILPGGESTTQGKLLKELGMFEILQHKIENGMPALGTCAGLILLAQNVEGQTPYFATLPVSVVRNAYGRQLGSFHTKGAFGREQNLPMTFIRAPYIDAVLDDECEILSEVKEHIVAVRYRKQLGIAFHPELDDDLRIHKLFLSL